jgi:AraC-like DNA-binding protein/DNA gyrase inhibitor GyrI
MAKVELTVIAGRDRVAHDGVLMTSEAKHRPVMTVNSTQETIYQQRINSVISYVRENLEADLSLEKLAGVAGFSPFHFHRVFKALTEETINEMVVRLRLERAAALLRASPELSITDAAFAVGFNAVATFSRAFKKQYGLPASHWDRQSHLQYSKIDQHPEPFARYTIEQLSALAGQDAYRVEIRSLPKQRLAYLRVYDSYSDFERIKAAYGRLLAWYCRQGGQLRESTLYGMSQDDPSITPPHLCRFDWSLRVPDHWEAEGEIALVDFPACQVATIRCQGDIAQEDRVLQYLFRYWLPRSRYQPANLPAMEIYRRHPAELGWEIYDIDCALPVVALGGE